MKLLLCLLGLAASVCTGSVIKESSADDTKYMPHLEDQRIVGGSEVHVALYPHQITLRYKSIFSPTNAFAHRCGGALYSERIVITAAHCVIGTVPSQHKVVAGTNNRRGSDGYVLSVQEIIQHEDYNPDTYDNDIAILILGDAMPMNNFTVKTIELAEEEAVDGKIATVTGWGTTTQGGIAADLLQEVQVPIVSNDKCNVDYDGLITDSMVCAGVQGVGGKDACQGDSGGPLTVDGKLVGIVSWGYGCARPEYPGVYANVPYLRSWLLKNIPEHF